jgi:hypothetical protein
MLYNVKLSFQYVNGNNKFQYGTASFEHIQFNTIDELMQEVKNVLILKSALSTNTVMAFAKKYILQ